MTNVFASFPKADIVGDAVIFTFPDGSTVMTVFSPDELVNAVRTLRSFHVNEMTSVAKLLEDGDQRGVPNIHGITTWHSSLRQSPEGEFTWRKSSFGGHSSAHYDDVITFATVADLFSATKPYLCRDA